MSGNYGHLVRLWGIHPSQLPEKTATPEELTPFLMTILLEAAPFVSDVPSAKQSPFTSSWQSTGSRSFRHSQSPVYLYERTVPVDALQAVAREYDLPQVRGGRMHPEKWHLRRSVHEDATTPGTACWREWVRCFKERHAEAERDFSPAVLSTRVEREWDCRGVEVEYEEETWVDWTLKLEESVHKMPMPLKNRVFPVLQATAATREGRQVMIVQIAAPWGSDVDVQGGAAAAAGAASSTTTEAGNVRGAYTSIERLRQTNDGIEWVMGTTSDAKGALPAWVQNMVMPGPIAKDVDMFLGWIAKQRQTEGQFGDQGQGAKDEYGQQQNGGGMQQQQNGGGLHQPQPQQPLHGDRGPSQVAQTT